MNERLSEETFLAIVCNFPVTPLDGTSVTCHRLALSSALALQQLLSLPTLCRAHIKCYGTEPALFLQIWDRCSTSLRHLELGFGRRFSDGLLSTQHYSSTIRLESLQILQINRLAMQKYSNIQPFCPPIEQLEVLDFTAHAERRMDLSSSPPIAPSNRILKIILEFNCDDVPLEQLDSRLSCLPLKHSAIIEFGTPPDDHARLIASLPRLSSQTIWYQLRLTDFNRRWFTVGAVIREELVNA
ncbi:hypothetical protein C8R44DRAFT_883740 [Mycena epipterygia]|nr:hypothetical protein C8R44DRAFT_883740 [Mycena epipterygia]